MSLPRKVVLIPPLVLCKECCSRLGHFPAVSRILSVCKMTWCFLSRQSRDIGQPLITSLSCLGWIFRHTGLSIKCLVVSRSTFLTREVKLSETEPAFGSEELDMSVIQTPEAVCEQAIDLENLFSFSSCISQQVSKLHGLVFWVHHSKRWKSCTFFISPRLCSQDSEPLCVWSTLQEVHNSITGWLCGWR